MAARFGAFCVATSTISPSACAASKALRSMSSSRCFTSSSSPVNSKCSAPCPSFGGRSPSFSSGGNDFAAVYGSWDALIPLARELQRMFQRFTEENLKDFPGAEAKTITMACTLAESADASLAAIYEQCGYDLALAKAADKDCIFIMDRVLEWKQLGDAAELKEAVERIEEEFRGGKQFLAEVLDLYQKVSSPLQKDQEKLLRRAYRFQRKYSTASKNPAVSVSSPNCVPTLSRKSSAGM